MEQMEREDLLAAVQDLYRRKTKRNLKAAGAGAAGLLAGLNSEDPTAGLQVAESILTPGYGPGSNLSEKDRLDAQTKLLSEWEKAKSDRLNATELDIEAMLKAGKADDSLAKYTVQLATGIAQTDAQVRSARTSALASVSNKVQDKLERALAHQFGTDNPIRLQQLQDAVRGIEAAFSPQAFSTSKDEQGRVVVTLNEGAVSQAIAAFNSVSGITDRSAIVATMLSAAMGAGRGEQDVATTADELANALRSYPDAAPLVAYMEGEGVREAEALMMGAAAEFQEYAEETARKFAGSAGMTPEKIKELAEVMKGLSGSAEAPEESIKRANELIDKWGEAGKLDPEANKNFADALDELDPESETYNPTLEMVRQDLFQRPDFQEYMNNTGITDPMMALRQLKKEARNAHRGSVQASREAMDTRNRQLRDGAPDPTMTGAPAVAGEGPGQARSGNIQAAAMATDPHAMTPEQKRKAALRTYSPGHYTIGRALAPAARKLKDQLKKRKDKRAEKDTYGNG